MRLHPAVACAMLVVGAILLVTPLVIWAYLVRNVSLSIDQFPAPVALAVMLGTVSGMVLIVLAVLFSFNTRDPDRTA